MRSSGTLQHDDNFFRFRVGRGKYFQPRTHIQKKTTRWEPKNTGSVGVLLKDPAIQSGKNGGEKPTGGMMKSGLSYCWCAFP